MDVRSRDRYPNRRMKVIPLNAGDGLAEFLEFPRAIYRDDPLWVPPLRDQVFYELSGSNTLARYGRLQPFLCEADGQSAGRIVALVNPRLVDANGAIFGQLGYFECVDDPAVASALIDAGLDWLKAQGITQVLGPMNGGAHRTHRFLTRGFDRDPYLFEPRNPPYYPALFERSGFVPVGHWYGYDLTAQQAAEHWHRFDRVLTRRPSPYRMEELTTGQSQETLVRVHRLMNACWAGHAGYAALEFDEFADHHDRNNRAMCPLATPRAIASSEYRTTAPGRRMWNPLTVAAPAATSTAAASSDPGTQNIRIATASAARFDGNPMNPPLPAWNTLKCASRVTMHSR
jgi:hypothetical protein